MYSCSLVPESGHSYFGAPLSGLEMRWERRHPRFPGVEPNTSDSKHKLDGGRRCRRRQRSRMSWWIPVRSRRSCKRPRVCDSNRRITATGTCWARSRSQSDCSRRYILNCSGRSTRSGNRRRFHTPRRSSRVGGHQGSRRLGIVWYPDGTR